MLRFRNSQSAARRRYQWENRRGKHQPRKRRVRPVKARRFSMPAFRWLRRGIRAWSIRERKAERRTSKVESIITRRRSPIFNCSNATISSFGFSTIRNNRRLWCPRGSAGRGKANVGVAYATPGTELHKKLVAAHSKGKYLHVDASHSMAKQAFAAQNAADAAKAKAAGGKG